MRCRWCLAAAEENHFFSNVYLTFVMYTSTFSVWWPSNCQDKSPVDGWATLAITTAENLEFFNWPTCMSFSRKMTHFSIFLQILIRRLYLQRRMYHFVHEEEEICHTFVVLQKGWYFSAFPPVLCGWSAILYVPQKQLFQATMQKHPWLTVPASTARERSAYSSPGNNAHRVTGLPSPRNKVIASAQRYRRMKRSTKDAPPASLSKTPRPKPPGWAPQTAAVKAFFQSHLSHFSLLIKRSGTLILPLTLKGDCSCLEERLCGLEGHGGGGDEQLTSIGGISLIKMK